MFYIIYAGISRAIEASCCQDALNFAMFLMDMNLTSYHLEIEYNMNFFHIVI